MRPMPSRSCSSFSWEALGAVPAWARGVRLPGRMRIAHASACARPSARMANPLSTYAGVEALVRLAALVFHAIFVAVTDWSYESLLPALGNEWLALAAKLRVSCAPLPPAVGVA